MRDKKLTKAKAHFCTLVAKGDQSIVNCLIEAYPKYRGKTANTIKSQAKRLVTRPDIIKEIARQKEEMAAKVEDKYAGLKDEMVDRLVKGIREGTDPEGGAIGIVDFVPAIKQLSTMLGWDAPKDINLRNGGYTKDYQGPPTLMTMSDEEISAKLKELRGDG